MRPAGQGELASFGYTSTRQCPRTIAGRSLADEIVALGHSWPRLAYLAGFLTELVNFPG